MLILLPFVYASSITINETCNSTQTCLFSIYQHNNTHIAECNYYNYSVCYPEASLTINWKNTSCNSSEIFILSTYRQNNTHISTDSTYYNYSICLVTSSWTGVYINDSVTCKGTHTNLGTTYRHNNSHYGNIGYYNYSICLNTTAPFPPAPTGGGGTGGGGTQPFVLNATAILPKVWTDESYIIVRFWYKDQFNTTRKPEKPLLSTSPYNLIPEKIEYDNNKQLYKATYFIPRDFAFRGSYNLTITGLPYGSVYKAVFPFKIREKNIFELIEEQAQNKFNLEDKPLINFWIWFSIILSFLLLIAGIWWLVIWAKRRKKKVA